MRYINIILVIAVVVFMSASAAGEISSPGPLILHSNAMWGSDDHHPPPPPSRSKHCPPDKGDHGDSKDDHGDKKGDHNDKDHGDHGCGKGDDSKNP